MGVRSTVAECPGMSPERTEPLTGDLAEVKSAAARRVHAPVDHRNCGERPWSSTRINGGQRERLEPARLESI